MKTYKKETKEYLIVDEITCNKCGRSCIGKHMNNQTGLSVEYHTNYDNDILPDVTSYYFDLCEQCLVDLISSFMIKPATTGDLS